jgi:Sulfotransferase family
VKATTTGPEDHPPGPLTPPPPLPQRGEGGRGGEGAQARDQESPFSVPSFVEFLGGLVHHHRAFWLWLGRVESSRLAEQVRQVPLRMPIYVCGLARSGSTLLHEVVSSHPSVATHRMKDYPMLFTPYWWRRATASLRPAPPRERLHRDGVMVTTESPDALEEMLWMAFFPRCHDPAVCNLLGAEDSHPAFESFYRLHIRKLLLAEGATRYAAKANYHVARLGYLARLFPDARFVIPVRSPAGHIASLLRQHRWFSRGERKHPRALAYMRRSGHFEFGRDRRPIHLGDGERVRRIVSAWSAGDEVRGLALYWDMVYGYLARLLAADARVREAALVVRFEELCAAPAETLRAVFAHCALPDAESIVERHAPGIRSPTYYRSDFSAEDLAVIRAETADTARLWGY